MDPISAPARLWLLATGHFLPRCLHVIAELGVADHVHDAPVGLETLARQSGCDAPSLGRMLRLLESAGLFQQAGEGWAHTDLSRHLRSGPVQWAALGELASAGPSPAKVLDVVMLTLTGGRERSRDDYASLFKAGGFRLDRVVPTTGGISVLVGIPG